MAVKGLWVTLLGKVLLAAVNSSLTIWGRHELTKTIFVVWLAAILDAATAFLLLELVSVVCNDRLVTLFVHSLLDE